MEMQKMCGMTMGCLYYFGTTRTQPGHYLFRQSGEMIMQRMTNRDLFKLPFNPEQLTDPYGNLEMFFKQIKVCATVFAVNRSPCDTRPGCKSVWWLPGEHLNSDLATAILADTFSAAIVDKLPPAVLEYLTKYKN